MRTQSLRIRSRYGAGAILALLVVIPLEAGEKHCHTTAEVCLLEMASKLRDRGWVGIQLDRGPRGMSVTKVWPESPAERAGLAKGDLLVAFEGVPYAEDRRTDLKAAYRKMKPGYTVTYTVIRGERQFEVAVKLMALPEEMIAQWVGQHYLEAHLPPAHAREAPGRHGPEPRGVAQAGHEQEGHEHGSRDREPPGGGDRP